MLTRKSNMADTIQPKTNILLPETYYIDVHISNYKKTNIFKVKFNLFKQLCSFACL